MVTVTMPKLNEDVEGAVVLNMETLRREAYEAEKEQYQLLKQEIPDKDYEQGPLMALHLIYAE
jgi:hypothetical protein